MLAGDGLPGPAWALSVVHPLWGGGPVGWPPTEADFDIELNHADMAFVLAQVVESIDVTTQILASDRLHSQVRKEQELSPAGLEDARSELQGRR